MKARKPYKDSLVLWQTEPPEGEGIAEPAILLEAYSDCVSITQGDNSISVSIYSVDEFCRHLKKLYKK